MRKGQLLSLDLLFSVALVTLAIGLSVQYNEAIQKSLAASTQSSNEAEVIAAAILGEGMITLPTDGFCAEYYDVNGGINKIEKDCTNPQFTCPNMVYVATRIVECPSTLDTACSLVVKTCG